MEKQVEKKIFCVQDLDLFATEVIGLVLLKIDPLKKLFHLWGEWAEDGNDVREIGHHRYQFANIA